MIKREKVDNAIIFENYLIKLTYIIYSQAKNLITSII